MLLFAQPPTLSPPLKGGMTRSFAFASQDHSDRVIGMATTASPVAGAARLVGHGAFAVQVIEAVPQRQS